MNILNYPRRIGGDKHVHGRLISKIQNGFIFLFTDGGKLNNENRVLTKNSKINFFSEKNEFYSEPLRWDYQLFSFVLGRGGDKDGITMIKKYQSLMGGQAIICEEIEELKYLIEEMSVNYFIANKVSLYLEINNNIINTIQQNEKKTTNTNIISSNKKQAKYNTGANSKHLIYLNVDYKGNLQIKTLPGDSNIIFDRNENIVYREKWPLPDEYIINKTVKSLPRRRAHPTYIIGNEVRFDTLPLELHRKTDYDEYDILDSEFITKFLENYADIKITDITNKKLLWDVYVLFQNSDTAKKPFGMIKLILTDKINIEPTNQTVLEYYNNNKDQTKSDIKLKFCVLPYNFREFFIIVSNYEKVFIYI